MIVWLPKWSDPREYGKVTLTYILPSCCFTGTSSQIPPLKQWTRIDPGGHLALNCVTCHVRRLKWVLLPCAMVEFSRVFSICSCYCWVFCGYVWTVWAICFRFPLLALGQWRDYPRALKQSQRVFYSHEHVGLVIWLQKMKHKMCPHFIGILHLMTMVTLLITWNKNYVW